MCTIFTFAPILKIDLMKVSYSWLKEYLDVDLPVTEVAEILTDTGLEVEGIEEIESIKGGLKGVVLGKVLTCVQHPNADKLKKTTVDFGAETPLEIVCGAPNVAVGQNVVVATVGTELHFANGDSLKIKKSKIRGEVSEGMICAEDELGLGKSHDGIMVLSEDIKTGSPAVDYFKLTSDFVIEIGLTPNRTDAMGHIGVARDLRAGLLRKNITTHLNLPSIAHFKVDNSSLTISVEVQNTEACGQYLGLTISGVTVQDSPDWIKQRLVAIGLTPVNNIVDITNYVLHETGHPLHAFDADKIAGRKVVVKCLPGKTKFTTLDKKERTLHEDDLMICNKKTPMCIAGVFGGIDSGVSQNTTNIFLESAWFHPVSIRKTARRHGLNTDASFRYERGVDPEMTEYALKRAAILIVEIAGGEVTSEIQLEKTQEFLPAKIKMSFARINKLIGQEIPKDDVHSILNSLDIHVNVEVEDSFEVTVPQYRADVTREADVIEEIIRIYGLNNIENPGRLSYSISPRGYTPSELKSEMNHYLSARGYFEIQNNSLTKRDYYTAYPEFKQEHIIDILNPLSSDLNAMSQTLLFGMMEVVKRNINYKNADMKLVEFGKNYAKLNGKFKETNIVALLRTGYKNAETWENKQQKTNFFHLKGDLIQLLEKEGVTIHNESDFSSEIFGQAISLFSQKKEVARIGVVSNKVLNQFGVEQEVFYAEVLWKNFQEVHLRNKKIFVPIAKYPAVRRDLALLVNKEVKYLDLQMAAQRNVKNILKSVNLFDVYEGKNLPEGKKSYALSFVLQDAGKTLNDKQIEKTMERLINVYQKEFGASLR